MAYTYCALWRQNRLTHNLVGLTPGRVPEGDVCPTLSPRFTPSADLTRVRNALVLGLAGFRKLVKRSPRSELIF